ncbi:MAG: transglutaminase domain-containing protein, partial [Deltaproteobacteria bacterium]|nr:transglutaminase domain-containing protein [Deltaproteobacteria bacterium]
RSVAEYRCLRAVSQPPRSWYPQRIVRNHYGNCGEIQDVVGAASRAALIPSMLTLSLEDHVWNEFYAGFGQWYPYDTGWSDAPMRVGEWAVSGDGDSGGGKENAVMLAWRGDGQMVNLLGRYKARWVDGKIDYEYAQHMEIEITIVDGKRRPVDGALVTLLTESYYSSASAVKAIFGVTNGDGKVVLRVGAEPRWGSKSQGGKRTFYVNVASAIGHWPKRMDISLYSPPMGQFKPFVTYAETRPDTRVQKEIVLTGKDDDGTSYGVIADPLVSEETWDPPKADTASFEVRLKLKVPAEYRSAKNPMNARSFFETQDKGAIDVYVMDRKNYDAFKAQKPFTAGLVKTNVASLDDVSLALPDASHDWMVVLSNARHAAFAELVEADVELVKTDASTPGPTPPDVTSEPTGCSCAVGKGPEERKIPTTSSLAIFLILAGLLLSRRR